jgi:hypothetical protein
MAKHLESFHGLLLVFSSANRGDAADLACLSYFGETRDLIQALQSLVHMQPG